MHDKWIYLRTIDLQSNALAFGKIHRFSSTSVSDLFNNSSNENISLNQITKGYEAHSKISETSQSTFHAALKNSVDSMVAQHFYYVDFSLLRFHQLTNCISRTNQWNVSASVAPQRKKKISAGVREEDPVVAQRKKESQGEREKVIQKSASARTGVIHKICKF